MDQISRLSQIINLKNASSANKMEWRLYIAVDRAITLRALKQIYDLGGHCLSKEGDM